VGMQGTQTVGRTEKPSGGDIPPSPPANSSPGPTLYILASQGLATGSSDEVQLR